MTEARVVLTAEAKEDLADLDGSAQKIVAKALVKLRTDPELRGAPLGSRDQGSLATYRKLVVGNRDYRIVYKVEEDGTICVIWVIAKRSDDEVYELAYARLATAPQTEILAQLKGALEMAKDL